MDSSVLVIVGRTCGCRSALHLGVLADKEIGWGQFLFFMALRQKWGVSRRYSIALIKGVQH